MHSSLRLLPGTNWPHFLIRPEDTLPFIGIFQITTVKPQKFNFSQSKTHSQILLCMICVILSRSLDIFTKLIRFNLMLPLLSSGKFPHFSFKLNPSWTLTVLQFTTVKSINFLNFQRICGLLISSPYSESIVKTNWNQLKKF